MRAAIPSRLRGRVSILILSATCVAGGIDILRPETVDTASEAVFALSAAKEAPVTLSDLTSADWYGSYTAIREYASGAALVADTGSLGSSQTAPLDRTFLLALGRISSLEEADLSAVVFPEGQPARSGVAVGGPWELFLSSNEHPDVLLARRDGDVLKIVDAREIAFDHDPGARAALRTPAAWSALRAGMFDAALLTVLMLGGGSIIPRKRFPRALRVLLAVPVGIAALAAVGVVRPPGIWSVMLSMALLGAIAAVLRARGCDCGWESSDVRPFALVSVAVAIAAVASRTVGLIWASADSGVYLAQGRLLAEGRLTADLLRLKRGVGQQQLHAPGFAVGAEGFQSLGPVMLLIGVGLIVLAGQSSSNARFRASWAVPALGAGVVLLSPAMTIMAAYVNSHVLVAVLLLTLVILLGLVDLSIPDAGRVDVGELVPAIGVVIFAIVLIRPEGTLLAGLVLLGTLRHRRSAPSSSWTILGIATIVWNATLFSGSVLRGESPARPVIGMLALGLVLLATQPVLRRMTPQRRSQLPLVLLVPMWVGALVLMLTDVGDVRFLDAAIVNLGEGQGRWGGAGVILPILGLVAVAARERSVDGPGMLGMRWMLLGFVPLTMFAKLGDGLEGGGVGLGALLVGGGRVGWGDSVNRSWMHVALLVVLLFVLRFSGETIKESRRGDRTAERSRLLSAWRSVLLVTVPLLALWIALQWKPFSLEGEPASFGWTGGISGVMIAIPLLIAGLASALFWLDETETEQSRRRALPAVGFLGVLLLLVAYSDDAEGARVISDGTSIPSGAAVPVGELVDGATIRQPIAASVVGDLSTAPTPAGICAEVLFATYLDRANVGTVLVELLAGGESFSVPISASGVRDNSWQRACFGPRSTAALAAVDIPVLVVRSEGGIPGASMTTFVRPAESGEPRATIAGAAGWDSTDGHVLLYRLVTPQRPLRTVVTGATGWAFVAVGSALGISAIRRGRVRDDA